MTEPFVFILDLDGTIIGDCSYQIILYNIEQLCKKYKIRTQSEKSLLKSYRPESKLMRPHFKYFIDNTKKHHPDSLFYIYTASDKEWAHKEISLIEKTHNIKFNRPIFTREDCILDSFGQYKKSVKKILPKIVKGNKKYNINNNKILVIDNNSIYIDYTSNFLLCPSYNYILYYDVWAMMKKEYMKIMEIYNTIKNLITTNKLCKYCTFDDTSDSQHLEDKHRWLYKKHKKINNLNKKHNNDTFWKNLARTIIDRNVTIFDKSTIEHLQKSASKQ
jgi:hypothetical protein